jgi:hypothetical protein
MRVIEIALTIYYNKALENITLLTTMEEIDAPPTITTK